MAFTVTPTSGPAPYLFEADVLNQSPIAWDFFSAHFYTVTGAGSCPAPSSSGTDNQIAAQGLVNNGVYAPSGGTIPSGSCGVFNLVIRDIASGDVVDSSFVAIDNV